MDDIRTPANPAPGSIREYLGSVRFPCSRDELVEDLRQHDAPVQLIDQVEGLPATRFDSLSDVLTALNPAG